MTEHATTIFQRFEQSVNNNPRKTALVYLGTSFSYKQLYELVTRFATSLHDLGIRKGNKVILYAPNSAPWVVAWLGIMRVGADCRAHNAHLHAVRPGLYRQ